MLKCLTNDSKIQLRLNIKRHRQKLLQYLENINDTVLKPKIELVSNDLEKSNLNYNANSSTEVQVSPKLEPNVRVANIKTRSSIRQQNKSLTNSEIKTPKHGSNVKVNRSKPNVKVKKEVESPLSNIEIKQGPIPTVEIKDSEQTPTIKPLKDLLIEELDNSSDNSSSDEFDDNISVGNNDDWNESYQPDTTIDKCNKRESSAIGAVKPYDGKSKEDYLYYSLDSDIPVSELNNKPNTRKRNRTRKKVTLAKPPSKVDSGKQHRFRKPQDRSMHNAKERACRELIAKKFGILSKLCSYLDTNRRVPSKHSILLAAKKECDLLRHFEKKIITEKKSWRKANEDLKKRLNVLKRGN